MDAVLKMGKALILSDADLAELERRYAAAEAALASSEPPSPVPPAPAPPPQATRHTP
jgi:hypothetical protein